MFDSSCNSYAIRYTIHTPYSMPFISSISFDLQCIFNARLIAVASHRRGASSQRQVILYSEQEVLLRHVFQRARSVRAQFYLHSLLCTSLLLSHLFPPFFFYFLASFIPHSSFVFALTPLPCSYLRVTELGVLNQASSSMHSIVICRHS
jgi:hypothetical protein